MAPNGLAILIEADAATSAGIARVLSDPSQGNMAVALLGHRAEALRALNEKLQKQMPEGLFAPFVTDTTPEALTSAFDDIEGHPCLRGLKLRLAIYSVEKCGHTPFLDGTHAEYTGALAAHAGGAFQFAQLAVRRLLADHGTGGLIKGAKGTLVFTGTLEGRRCGGGYAAAGGGCAAVHQLAQSLASEFSEWGIHVVHAIPEARIEDADHAGTRAGRAMSAEAVGREYLFLHHQPPSLWTHELDMRPALHKS